MTATLTIAAPMTKEFAALFTPEAQSFVAALAARFTARRDDLLLARHRTQERLNAGELPDFLPETRAIREGAWKVAPIPTPLSFFPQACKEDLAPLSHPPHPYFKRHSRCGLGYRCFF